MKKSLLKPMHINKHYKLHQYQRKKSTKDIYTKESVFKIYMKQRNRKIKTLLK